MIVHTCEPTTGSIRLRLGLAAAIAIAVALGATAASGQVDSATDFKRRVETARLQAETDFAAGMEQLDALDKESKELRGRRKLTEAERAGHRELYLVRARAFFDLLDNASAAQSFRELLRVDPLFAGDLAPREREILQTLRNSEGGTLEISGGQSGGQVFINGVRGGATGSGPLSFKLLPGEYEVRVEKDGYQPAVTTSTIRTGAVVALSDLNPTLRVPPVAFVSDREDVEVWADGNIIGKTVQLSVLRSALPSSESAAIERLAAGAPFTASAGLLFRQPMVGRTMTIKFRRDCYAEETRTISITPEALSGGAQDEPMLWFPEASAVRMRADMGTVRIESQPSDADVLIDDQLIGRTPFVRDVCAGQRRVRVRHRIGSFAASVAVEAGAVETINAVLRPQIAVLGAVDLTGQPTPAPDVAVTLRKTVSSAVTSYSLASRLALPSEIQGWTDASTQELVSAIDRGDAATVSRLLRLANESYDAPLLLTAARRPDPAGGAPIVELLVFWADHPGADQVIWNPSTDPDPRALIARLNEPADVSALTYMQEVEGIRVADTALAEAPLMVVHVEDRSNAATSGMRAGDTVLSVDGAPANAQRFHELADRKKPGETITLQTSRPGNPPRNVPLPVQRIPRAAPVFDASLYGNALIARLTVASASAATDSERTVYAFNIALAKMRYGEWRDALTQLTALGGLPTGIGIGPGASLYYRARCHEELAEVDRALALYKEASAIENQILTPDGTTVAAAARRKLSRLSGGTARTP